MKHKLLVTQLETWQSKSLSWLVSTTTTVVVVVVVVVVDLFS